MASHGQFYRSSSEATFQKGALQKTWSSYSTPTRQSHFADSTEPSGTKGVENTQ